MMVTLKNRISPSLTVEVHPRQVFNARHTGDSVIRGSVLFVALAIDYPRKRLLVRSILGITEMVLPSNWFWSA
jgi:hypothetical protein